MPKTPQCFNTRPLLLLIDVTTQIVEIYEMYSMSAKFLANRCIIVNLLNKRTTFKILKFGLPSIYMNNM